MNPQIKTKVLMVDDDERNMRILKRSFRDFENIETEEAVDGKKALELYESFKPDMVFLDIMMPNVDGYEVCRKIREDFEDQETKIILLSGRATLEDKVKGYNAGADDYITKPFDPPELRAKFKVFSNLVSARKELKRINGDLNTEIEIRTQALFKQEKDASIGRDAARIVHNLRNPLSLIAMVTNILDRKQFDPKLVKKLNIALDQMKELISNILSQARRDSADESPFSEISTVMEEVIEILSLPAEKDGVSITFASNIHPQINVLGTKTELNQVFSNIIQNGVQALSKSNSKTISINLEEMDSMIILTIKDSGHGIPSDVLPKIFDLHFTTKNNKHEYEELGTGIGLAYCKKVIESYGGKIEVTSEPGKGATFTLTLPIYLANSPVLKAS